jgi:hypothetical protein
VFKEGDQWIANRPTASQATRPTQAYQESDQKLATDEHSRFLQLTANNL